jgi:hypothetical protein
MSILGGLTLVGVAAFLNANHAAATEGWSSPTVIAIFVLAMGSALGVPVITASWRNGHKAFAALGIVGLVSGELFGFQLSAERLLAARAQRAQQVKTVGSPYAQAKEALDLAISERRSECADGLGKRCSTLRGLEDQKRVALAALPVPTSHTLVADATGLPEWFVEIVPAMTFSTGLLVLGFVLVGFAAHEHGSAAKPVEQTVATPAVLEPLPDEREQVVSWIREYRKRHGVNPRIPDVQEAFGLPKTTAWRRIQSS